MFGTIMGRSIAPFVALLFLVHSLDAILTSDEAIEEDEPTLSRERRFTNGDEQWTRSITEKSSSTTALSPSNSVEKLTSPIVLKPLQLTLVHKSVYALKPDAEFTSRQERNLASSSYSCYACPSDHTSLFEGSISRSGKLFSPTPGSSASSQELNGITDKPFTTPTKYFPRSWKSLLYKPRKSVVRGFLATPGKPFKEITEFSLISKYNDKSLSKNTLDSTEEKPKSDANRPKFTIIPAVVKHIPLSFTGTNEIFHNLLVKFVNRKNIAEANRDFLSIENNEIRRVGLPLNNFQAANHIASSEKQPKVYRHYRQIVKRPQVVPATLVYKHSSNSPQH